LESSLFLSYRNASPLCENSHGEKIVVADFVVHTAERSPNIDELNLVAAGIAVEGGRLRPNQSVQL